MTAAAELAVLGAGVAAGAVNAVVGSGTLITFPVLVAVGYPPVVANVSNAVGLVPGLVSGAFGYRRELDDQSTPFASFAAASLAGGTVGALLLLVLPAAAFRAIVPLFIAVALALVLLQPLLASRRRRAAVSSRARSIVLAALFVCGVYGGYFGAAQGVLLLAILGLRLPDRIQEANAIKNILNLLTNVVAAAIFVTVAPVAWGAALLVAAGSMIGGAMGARIGRRLRPAALRSVVFAVGAVALVRLVGA